MGFRPFVFRIAEEEDITGSVANTSIGVTIEAQGSSDKVDRFLCRLEEEAPPVSIIDSVAVEERDLEDSESEFIILFSDESESKTVTILPDLATCPDCREDISAPENRRFGYAFTNCTNCGPRFSIINDIPYDRKNTEMKSFEMCGECETEYTDPSDRRFHAQPNACPECGPQITLRKFDSNDSEEILDEVIRQLREGKIIAFKGIGGFQLLCDATNDEAVKTLRKRKRREEKPFAVMFKDLDTASKYCVLGEEEADLLNSLASPIVLLTVREGTSLSEEIAPDNPNLGVMIPYTPLHHLLMSRFEFPVVCTSGNYHDEPIAIDNDEAFGRLDQIADIFLHHNRPIARYIDDSVVRHTKEGVQYFRRARGYAPLPIRHNREMPNILSVGAHLKNTIAISFGNQTILSQHVGDLSTPEALRAFSKVVEDLPRLYDFKPEIVACDLHPDYHSTEYAESLGLPVIEIQHHHAHAAAVMAEHQESGEVLGITWDGVGLGDDGTVWGGEFLLCKGGEFERVAHLKEFPLPGGDLASLEPRRSAMGLLHAAEINTEFNHGYSDEEYSIIKEAISKKVNSPLTSSMGRLFDGVASIIGLRNKNKFEGQSAMALEFAAEGELGDSYPYEIRETNGVRIIDWAPILMNIIKERDSGSTAKQISSRFHSTLIKIIVEIAQNVGAGKVALGGGTFQNKILYEAGINSLREAGFEVLTPINLPTGDGGLAAGQAWAAALKL